MTVNYRWVEPRQRDLYPDAPVPEWPQHLLDRYRAKILKPSEVVLGEFPFVRSTTYRTCVLLIPEKAIQTDGLFRVIEDLLKEISFGIEMPPPLNVIVRDRDLHPRLERLPRPVHLVELPDGPAVDAWVALQHLRRALRTRDFSELDDAQLIAALKALADQISLEHVVRGALGYDGVPTYEPHHGTGVATDEYSAVPARTPVTVGGRPPWRDPGWAGRRPVVAVLDSGVLDHPWFGDLQLAGTRDHTAFLRLFEPAQDAILAQEAKIPDLPQSSVLTSYRDEPIFENAMTDVVNPATGHATFIGGIIHQNAPEADVLMVRVLHPDNVALEGDVLLALWLLLATIQQAHGHNDRQHEIVDILSLSLGYYDENPDSDQSTRLSDVINELIAEGVVVVAAAGNDSTDRPFLPAALATLGPDPAGHRVIGVGALNPNSTIAWFSNGGPSVTCLAPGARVISTFPPEVKGSAGPARYAPAQGREQFDVDDFSAGFAVWDGTSFAAPHIAAEIANAMTKRETADTSIAGMRARATQAIQQLKDNEQQPEGQ